MSSAAPPSNAPVNTTVTTAAAPSASASSERVPSATTLLNAAKLAIQRDMPIQLDYFVDSADGKAFLGEDATTGEKMLVKNSEEYTSHIQKIYKAGDDFIIMTENSIYLVSGKVQKRKIQASTLKSGLE
jgi:hypothetical protein